MRNIEYMHVALQFEKLCFYYLSTENSREYRTTQRETKKISTTLTSLEFSETDLFPSLVGLMKIK